MSRYTLELKIVTEKPINNDGDTIVGQETKRVTVYERNYGCEVVVWNKPYEVRRRIPWPASVTVELLRDIGFLLMSFHLD